MSSAEAHGQPKGLKPRQLLLTFEADPLETDPSRWLEFPEAKRATASEVLLLQMYHINTSRLLPSRKISRTEPEMLAPAAFQLNNEPMRLQACIVK